MSNDHQTSRSLGSLGLRTRLTLGFVGLLAILIVVGVESISLLSHLGDSILRESYVEDASRRMALLLLVGTAFAGLCVLFLSRSILGPLERLTWAAGRIESEDLDLTVPVTSRDELGQIAAAFNSMASGLRELRETDQARLLRARRISQLAIDHLAEAVAVLSADRRVELVNRSASDLLGLRPGEPVPERHHGWLVPLLDRVETGRLPERGAGEVVRLRLADRERFLLPRAAVLRNGQDRSEGFVLVLEDVTDRHRCGEVHTGLLTNAAHDLEAALGPLRSALESLRSDRPGPLTPRQVQLLGGARDETERLGEIAANLLSMSRLEERRQQLHPEPVPPRDLIDAAIREVAARSRRERVELAIEVSPEAPHVLADREQAGRVLSTLLHNALAHTPAGGRVTVRAEPCEGRIRFTVADTGHGIPQEHLERIFEPFYQVPGTQDLGGVGLGLAIAREIVQSHGREIHCESEEGRGTTFRLTLPATAG